ncbi:MAG: hypothetical protein ABIR11_09845 [Candidatus Limnocylindrales bacterium]
MGSRAVDDEPITPANAFWTELHRSRLDIGIARLAPVGLAIVVTGASVVGGLWPALLAALLGATVLVVSVAALDRDRWHAQDVAYWYHGLRTRRWLADTGGPSPTDDRGHAEAWLGVHGRGTVPQIYRAVVAATTGDEVLAARELALVPEETPLDRARREWLAQARVVDAGRPADSARLRELVADVPDTDERSEMETFIAQVEAIGRHQRHAPDWLAPILGIPLMAGRVRPPARALLRLWVIRLRPLVAFGVLALILGSAAPAIFAVRIPDAYQDTTLATRGTVPTYDEDAVVNALPGLAHAVAEGTRTSGPLDEVEWSARIDDGLPTLLWGVGKIEVQAPQDAPGRLWQVEVLAGTAGDTVLLRFDSEVGPVYAYRIDGNAIERVRAALGVGSPTGG